MENKNKFDAIVIGSGISGGWAAKAFCDHGKKTLLLERGRSVTHIQDYPTTNKNPWELPLRGNLTNNFKEENPILKKCYAVDEATKGFFTKDEEAPYHQSKPFDWIRGYQEGGKSLIWARQTQRWSDYDFDGPRRDNYSFDWPIRYADIEKYYDKVEEFVGISGNLDGIPQLPDGKFLKPMEMNALESYLKKSLASNYPDRPLIIARCAHLSEVKPIHLEQGRGQCLYRNLCYRGCPFGAYFSSNASTIPWAMKTGHLTKRTNKIVKSIIYDETKKKASGVVVIDTRTLKEEKYYADYISVNASTINSNQILLRSTSERFPNGLGNDSGLLGTHLCFHNYRGKVYATYDQLQEFTKYGRRPTGCYIPRFKNLKKQKEGFKRGYAIYLDSNRKVNVETKGYGKELKESIKNPTLGDWQIFIMMMGETLPKASNMVKLHPTKKDFYGLELADISVDYDENDELMIKDFHREVVAMMEKSGMQNIKPVDTRQAPGLDIHEMGGAMMGVDPKRAVLNEFNQVHGCENVIVTDGACMNSTSTQNPSLTFMALTERAVHRLLSDNLVEP